MTNACPEISVIVPVFKAEKYLSKCIESILTQSFANFELILIDDGSPDCSGLICDEWSKKDIRIRVFHQKNLGVSAARNKGLDEACGKYIAFVDSDDWVLPDYLLRLYEALAENGKGLVVAGALKYFERNQAERVIILPDVCVDNNIGHFFVEYELYKYGFSCSKLYNRELIINKNLRFDIHVYCMEDLFFMMDYLLYSDYVVLCSMTDYVYRVGYSTNTLSSKINDFNSEYYIFYSFRERKEVYKKQFVLSDIDLQKFDSSLKMPFHRLLLSLYHCNNHYSYNERINYLCKLLSNDKAWIKKHFFPDYFADRIAKFLLCYIGKESFDIWMRGMFAVGFKYMFGTNK